MFAGLESLSLPRLAVLLQQLAVVVVAVVAAVVIRWLDDPRGRWGAALRSRFISGLPWGTLVSGGFVLSVYLFLQGGLHHWYRPLVIPFTAWSYFYPLGILTAPFSHTGVGHLVGNLVGLVSFAPLVEYAWGHFPRERGSSSFGSWATNPYVRAFVVFPLAVVGVGLLTSVFGLGPIIGFSGVVFAFAGFALVYYPLATVLALSAGQTIRLAYSAYLSPVPTYHSQPVFSTPWFADIAIQGHAIGLLLGVMLALWLSDRRGDDHPSALRVCLGVCFFAVAQSLWAVYWFRGNGVFVLYRAGGLALVLFLALLVTVGVSADVSRPFRRWSESGASDSVRAFLGNVTTREMAVVALLLSTAVLAGPAAGVNLLTTTSDDLPSQEVTVRDYHVTYAENVQNEMVSVVDADVLGESTSVNTSGVIVRSDSRDIWFTAVTKSKLAFDGTARVRVGGVGWRETVVAHRDGWVLEGDEHVYRVLLEKAGSDGKPVPVFESKPARADPVVDGHNVSIAVDKASGFTLRVTENNSTASAPVPARNESVTLDNITFTRKRQHLVAETERGTRLVIAEKETTTREALEDEAN